MNKWEVVAHFFLGFGIIFLLYAYFSGFDLMSLSPMQAIPLVTQGLVFFDIALWLKIAALCSSAAIAGLTVGEIRQSRTRVKSEDKRLSRFPRITKPWRLVH